MRIMRGFMLVIASLMICGTAKAQNENPEDSIRTKELKGVTIEGFSLKDNLKETPGSIEKISPETFDQFQSDQLTPVLNSVPGVRMERRANASYRISIRGSSIRAPFGVRNVKIYWNGMPYTMPAGDTDLNMLDMAIIDEAEIIRGPASVTYGAGTGGVVRFSNFNANRFKDKAYAGTEAGSYNYWKSTAGVNKKVGSVGIAARFSHQESDGFREQNFMDRKVAQLSAGLVDDSDWSLDGHFLYSDLSYGIPGGLNKEEYEEDPSQARGLFKNDNASIHLTSFMAGMHLGYNPSEKWEWNTWLYNRNTVFDHPFPFQYEKETRGDFGGRSIGAYRFNTGNINHQLVLGGEFQINNLTASSYQVQDGNADSLGYLDELRNYQAMAFFQWGIDFSDMFHLEAGFSYNNLNFNVNRLATGTGAPGREYTLNYEAQFANGNLPVAPRLAAMFNIESNMSVYASYSYGFAPPTFDEISDEDGAINQTLNPESGHSYEAGLKGTFNNWQTQVAAFYFNLEETIVRQPKPNAERAEVYHHVNSGKTDQRGVEVSLNGPVYASSLLSLRAQLSYTLHKFNFKNYVKNTVDYSGKQMPGIPENIVYGSVSARLKPLNIVAHLTHNYTSERALNDANDVYADAYHLGTFKLSYNPSIGDANLQVYGGINNLWNVDYSLGNDVNPQAPGRYYQPAPPRNYYAGLKIGI